MDRTSIALLNKAAAWKIGRGTQTFSHPRSLSKTLAHADSPFDSEIPGDLRTSEVSATYSYRSATIGSTIAARRAGIHAALSAIAASATASAVYVQGSVALNP